MTVSPDLVNVNQTISVTISGTDDKSVNLLMFKDGPSEQWYFCGGATSCSNAWTVVKSFAGIYNFEGYIYDSVLNSKQISGSAQVVECSGAVSLAFDPSTIVRNGSVQPVVSGLSNCQNKQAIFKDPGGNQVSSCLIGSDGGCVGSTFSALGSEGKYNYFVYADINGDGNYTDLFQGGAPDAGESASAVLNVSYGICFNSASACEGSCAGMVLGGAGCRETGYLTGACYSPGKSLGDLWCATPNTQCFCSGKNDPNNYQKCGKPGADIGFFSPIQDSYTTAGGQTFYLSPYAKDVSDLYVSGDNGQVRYWQYENGVDGNGYQYQQVKVDDKISGQCREGFVGLSLCQGPDLKMRNTWRFNSPDQLTISTVVENRCASHDLNVGFSFKTNPIKYSIAGIGNCLAGTSEVIALGPTASQQVGVPKETVVDLEFCGDGETNCGEACDGSNPGDPNRSNCNPDCALPVDATPPTSIIEPENSFSPIPERRALDDTRWLKDTTYYISITDSDNTGGSGIDTAQCKYTIDDLGRTNDYTADRTRTCNGTIPVSVGPTGDCQTQDRNSCRIIVISKDKANNLNIVTIDISQKFLNIDYTPPTAQ